MQNPERFTRVILSEFPEDRLTYQKLVPTFHPESAAEAAKLFQLANREKQELYITGFGNNIDPVGEEFARKVVVRTDRLNDFIKIVPEDFYIVVGAGFPLREINLDLEEHGLFLPHSSLPYVGSVGGSVAVNLSALWDVHVLPLSRYLIMAEIAIPQGEVIKPGSVCFKSVSGFDVVKIFAPSWGQLGMIATATFRVLPLSVKHEYEGIKMCRVEYGKFVSVYRNPDDNVSARYSLKIKQKFDPNNILPLIDTTRNPEEK